jgi:hypothetical protein
MVDLHVAYFQGLEKTLFGHGSGGVDVMIVNGELNSENW